MPELLISLVAAVVGTLPPLAQVAIKELLQVSPWAREAFKSPFGTRVLRILGVKMPGFTSGTTELFTELAKTSTEMDRIVEEIGRFTEQRQAKVIKLESDLVLLSQREQELKKKIEGLEKVPLPAAEYFAQLVEKKEHKGALRDYILFLLGVAVSAVITVVLKKLGWA